MHAARFLLAFLSTTAVAAACFGGQEEAFDVTCFGAVGDGSTDCTEAFNTAIVRAGEKASGRYKATVEVPAGTWSCRSIHLADNVRLHISKDAVIAGCPDPGRYDSFIPKRDLSRYDTGDGTSNANNTSNARWNRALIIGEGVHGAVICGEGCIDGCDVRDSLGEESMRGPHAILLAGSEDIVIEGITITNASNYAFMGYDLKGARFEGMHISGGWDGIHIRGGEDIEISGCLFETGDDCIAGGYWKDIRILGCTINSSCNGIRVIMPAERLTVSGCSFEGPGRHPHLTSGEARRNNMLFGISLEPGAWGPVRGVMESIVLEDISMHCLSAPVSTSVREGVEARDTIRNLSASGIYGTPDPASDPGNEGSAASGQAVGCASLYHPVVSWCDLGFERVSISGFTVTR